MNGYSIENMETEAVTGHGGNKEIVTFRGVGNAHLLCVSREHDSRNLVSGKFRKLALAQMKTLCYNK